MYDITKINELLAELEDALAKIDARRAMILEEIKRLRHEKHLISQSSAELPKFSQSSVELPKFSQFSAELPKCKENTLVTEHSALDLDQKISLFRSLFKGREDVYPKRFESTKTGKKGYQPACRNEWLQGICNKPKIKCGDCKNREFLPVTDEVIRNHLLGIWTLDKPLL